MASGLGCLSTATPASPSEPTQAAAAPTSLAVEHRGSRSSPTEGPGHRPPRPCSPAGGDDTAAGAAVEEWDDPKIFSYLFFLENDGDTQRSTQQPRGPAAAAPGHYPAAAAAEKPPAKRTPLSEELTYKWGKRGATGGAAGTQGNNEPLRAAAATVGPAKSRPPAAVSSSSSAKPARVLHGRVSHERGDVVEVQAGAGKPRAEMQAGGAEGPRTSLSEDGVLVRAGGGGDGTEGTLDSVVEENNGAPVPVEGPAVGKEGGGGRGGCRGGRGCDPATTVAEPGGRGTHGGVV